MSKTLDEPENETADDNDPGRRSDPELLAMGRMLRLLNDLDEPAKSRVVRWLMARYVNDKGYVNE